ncbi:hypothetical protein B9T25_05100 [Acinetobacter sp. ANC 4470]|nr:hypothetical protein B9T25_05100 [Acinetobacter sp. ANC 4470]
MDRWRIESISIWIFWLDRLEEAHKKFLFEKVIHGFSINKIIKRILIWHKEFLYLIQVQYPPILSMVPNLF